MKNGKKKLTIVSIKRNKGLEPMLIKNIGTVGYDPEIHGEDSLEYKFKLPLGSIKRVIASYFEEIKDIDEDYVYFHQSGSSGLRMKPYAFRMLNAIEKQLDKHGLEGKKIVDEVFDKSFKNDYEKMNRFNKNHSEQDPMDFAPCEDLLCCNYTNNLFFKIRIFLKLVYLTLKSLNVSIPVKEPCITWY